MNYNNGLAEGSVNKLKVIKRIMYGRNNFERDCEIISVNKLSMIK